MYTLKIKEPLYLTKSRVIIEKSDAPMSEIIKSDIVIKELISRLNIQDISITQLLNTIAVSYNKDTKIVQIAYVNKDQNFVAKLTNEITNIYIEKISELYEIKDVRIIEEAKVPETPYNVNHIKDMIVAISGAFLIIVIYLITCFMLDTRILTKEEIEALEINILGVLPEKLKEGK